MSQTSMLKEEQADQPYFLQYPDHTITEEDIQNIISSYLLKFSGTQGILRAGTGNNVLKIDGNGLYMGNSTFASAPFSITYAGALIATSATITGSITATSGTIGGFTIGASTITATNLTLTSGAANTANVVVGTGANAGGLNSANAAGDIIFWGGSTFANRATAPFNVTAAGAVTGSSVTITGGSISSTPISSIPNNTSTDISLLEFTHNLAFTSASATQINWTSGTIVLSNGRTFAISSGNTGSMAAATYIYLDTGVSSTVLQKTTTYSTAMGANKILVATAQNNAVAASCVPFGGGQPILDGVGNIAALSITAASIAASTITGGKIAATTITASNIAAGTITTNEIAATTIVGSNINTLNISGKNAVFDTGTIGGFTMGATTLSATNFTVTSGAANTANLTVGTGANAAGLNSANVSSDIVFWGGSTFANRATAPFRVTAGGALTATNITITGVQAGSSIDGQYLLSQSVTATQIANTTITATQIANLTITASQIANLTVTSGKVANTTLTAGNMATGLTVLPQMVYSTMFESSTAFDSALSGTGSINWTSSGVSLLTGANANSGCQVQRATSIDAFATNSYISATAKISVQGTDRNSFFGAGNITRTSGTLDYTPKHYGFKLNRAASVSTNSATNANGTTETATAFTVTETNVNQYNAQKNGTTNIKFYSGQTLQATQSTNLPSSGTGSLFQASIGDTSVASASEMDLENFTYAQDVQQ